MLNNPTFSRRHMLGYVRGRPCLAGGGSRASAPTQADRKIAPELRQLTPLPKPIEDLRLRHRGPWADRRPLLVEGGGYLLSATSTTSDR